MTTPAPIPGWYPDTPGKNLRYWDGTAWTSAVRPAPVSRVFGLSGRWWALIAVVVVAVLLVGGVIRWWLHYSAEQQRWSLWPHTMSCAMAPSPDFPEPPPPASMRAQQVTVERIEGAKVAVSVEFAAPPPGPARQVGSPYGGMMDAPGSLHVQFLITAPHLGSPTAYEKKSIVIEARFLGSGAPWRAWQSNLSPSGEDREVPVSVATSGRVMRLELDLTGQDRLFGDGPFTPTVLVYGFMTTPPTRELIGGDLRFFQSQLCLWDTATTLDRPDESTTPIQSAPPPVASPSTVPREPCGPDQATAVRQALSRMGTEVMTGAAWDPVPLESNFDSCADLSTVLVTVAGGTGSSPMQALMFHRGEFLGTGTSKAYAFTSLDTGASTSDTIVLRYRSGQSCTACSDGVVTTVRYRWDGNSVQMLDPPPPGG